jgi:tRNA uridine 5-carboxymethylaminomethyl modification enzyme
MNLNNFDVIIVGGGHAGVEAAYAAAKLGSKTALISLNLDKISLMPCNPSIGGVGKGHIVYEISALGGLMPKLCSKTYLQARMLNTSKGPAVQGLRLQIDKNAYSKLSKEVLAQQPNLTLIAGKVADLVTNNDTVTGLILADGTVLTTKTVVLTTGTFLNGLMHVGHTNYPGGRRDEEAVTTLSGALQKLGLELGRLKTGTPPRILRTSIDFSQLEQQDIHDLDYLYEFYPQTVTCTLPCYIAYTNTNTHQTILDNAEKSPIYTGGIQGKPPRYCPSIEDKIKRFAHKESHHVFIEPEDATYEEVYPSGLSTAMPLEVQEKFIRSMQGFENAIITKAGYAVEYDYVEPSQLKHTLETKKIAGLFLAGQINGTTGYEEAAGQGLIAGINASQKAQNKPAFILSREESYIGVMIDDLVTLGVNEPYRMFTSRAERRILLRQDNVFIRLSPKAYELGMLETELYQDIKAENDLVFSILAKLQTVTNTNLLNIFGSENCNLAHIKNYLLDFQGELNFNEQALSSRVLQIIYAEIKYEDYLKREQKEIEKAEKYKNLAIPATLDLAGMPGLSKELQEKLLKHKPQTIAQALLIPGMTPAAVSLLIFKCRYL